MPNPRRRPLTDELRHDENYLNDEFDYDEDEQGAEVLHIFRAPHAGI